MPARRTYLIAETHAIAKPFIAALDLVRSDEFPKLRCYVSETALLAESRGRAAGGSPAVAAAVTASYLLGSAGHDAQTRLFCAASCEAQPGAEGLVGGVVLANRVVDELSGKGYYPDVLLAHELPEAGIETLAPGDGPPDRQGDEGGQGVPGTAGRSDSLGGPQLVDREFSGFLAAGLTFLAPHQVYCLAAVTGSRETQGGSRDRDADAGALFAASMGAILRLIEEAGRLVRPSMAALSESARRSIDALAVEMRLTAAQTVQLRALAEGAAARGLDVERLAGGARRPVRTKQERNRGFDELKRLFRQQ